MLLDFRDIHDHRSAGSSSSLPNVSVFRDRHRGTPTTDNMIALYQKKEMPNAFLLFVEPVCSEIVLRLEGDPLAFGGRLLEDRACEIIAGGATIEKEATNTRAVNFAFICDNFPVEKVALLLAMGFAHEELAEFWHLEITHQHRPFLGIKTVAQLINHFYTPSCKQ